ncbi:MAG TPA: DUF2062 domain-containing protein [Burkholderiales bacterium]|nr:DUF2062 domain-containing protein [Burkholderiales bacterium]
MARRWIGRWLPKREELRGRRTLRWLGPLLERPWLWHINRRGVAMGVAIGVFFGFLVPIMQIPLSAVAAVLLRANLPIAALSTLVSNPFTYAPIFVAAYRVGAMMLGEQPSEADAAAIEREVQDTDLLSPEAYGPTWWQRFADVGQAMMLGLAVFAVVGGISAYFAALAAWRISVLIRLRRRRARRR